MLTSAVISYNHPTTNLTWMLMISKSIFVYSTSDYSHLYQQDTNSNHTNPFFTMPTALLLPHLFSVVQKLKRFVIDAVRTFSKDTSKIFERTDKQTDKPRNSGKG